MRSLQVSEFVLLTDRQLPDSVILVNDDWRILDRHRFVSSVFTHGMTKALNRLFVSYLDKQSPPSAWCCDFSGS